MVSKMKKLLKKYPIIIGLAGITILIAYVVSYWYLARRNEIIPTVITRNLEREQNIEGLHKPESAVQYLVQALNNNDIDQAMRIFPIDEICLQSQSADIISKKNEFYVDTILAPAREYRDYFALSSSELTGKYAELYKNLQKEIAKFNLVEIKIIDYIHPELQLQSQYQLEMLQKCEMYGANALCEMGAVLQLDGNDYILKVTLVNYYGYWKVMWTDLEFIEREESSEMKSEQSKELEDSLNDKIEDEQSTKEVKKQNDKQAVEMIKQGNALLPPNYFVANAVYETTPQKVLKKFVRYIQKKDLLTALTLGNPEGSLKNLEETSVELLIDQGKFAKKVKYFYYSFLMEYDVNNAQILSELGINGSQVIDKLNPGNFFYLELKEIIPVSDNEYDVFFKYEGEYFRFRFVFADLEQGWQISDIKDAARYSEKEYYKIVRELGEDKE